MPPQGVPRIVSVFAAKGVRLPARRPPLCFDMPRAFAQPVMETIFPSGLFDWGLVAKKYVHGPEITDPRERYTRFGASMGYCQSRI